MSVLKSQFALCCTSVCLATGAIAQPANGQIPLNYEFSGFITEVSINENDVIPNLMVGDEFTGFMDFSSSSPLIIRDRSDRFFEYPSGKPIGSIFVTLNGVDLFFEGESVYVRGDVVPSTFYSLSIGADAGGDIGQSTFAAANFGPGLEDSDGSAGYSELFPSKLSLPEFELNTFRFWGTYIETGDTLSATGQLTEFAIPSAIDPDPNPATVPEPSSGWLMALVTLVFLTASKVFSCHPAIREESIAR